MIRATLFAALLLAPSLPALAQTQNSLPHPSEYDSRIPEARNTDYPGTMTLDIDATDVQRGIFRVKQAIPVAKAGHMVLLFPEWLPGNHAPRGQIEKLTGLKIRAGGKELAWRRDSVEVFAFHIDVPAGAKKLELEFQFVSATASNQGRIVMAPMMLNLQWQSMSLYPAGYFTRRIPVQATVRYPEGWTAVSALPAKASGATYSYQKTDYDTLVDSPVFAGRWYREWALSPDVDLNVFADDPKELEAKPEQIEKHRELVRQAQALFGAQHFDKYEFLLAISSELGGIGLEHHRSSENQVDPGYFTDWDAGPGERNLLPHEYTHSWAGKFRRPAGIWTPDFRTPMRGELLWAYEGLDQFWGYVLGSRSGLFSTQETLDALAAIAAGLDNRPARTWRPLADTGFDPVLSARRPKPWVSWQRSEDYYNEGLLIWLEADSILRAKSGGTKSMDDFARAFLGINDRDWGVVTFEMEDVARTLNAIVPYDWMTFLKQRTEGLSDRAPLAGLTGNGYRLVYTDEPTPWFKSNDKRRNQTDLSYSIGLVLGRGGAIASVTWDSPAFEAGLDLGDELIAVNGMAFTADRLKDAIRAKEPVKLIVKSGDRIRELAIDYRGGLRYPRLEKIGEGEAGLDRLLAPR
ncbi:M61 family metallopeptidase [Sphingomonas canadensis]|uniref:M61 family metallopeptidase n=1 Tax=Sphingomonas canadensis TaxID=1219257 RepID=A0ABW3H913_9SPHN|nr:peptidase M61 [Sphingomonas canadensis]MCW3836611.1 peptidase M61 [Sphingomonas canadensis]